MLQPASSLSISVGKTSVQATLTAQTTQSTPTGPAGTAVLRFPGVPAALHYRAVDCGIKPRTAEVLVKAAVEAFAPFGIPDLLSWAFEVFHDVDDDFYIVSASNPKGATLSLTGIHMTRNRTGISYHYGVAASTSEPPAWTM